MERTKAELIVLHGEMCERASGIYPNFRIPDVRWLREAIAIKSKTFGQADGHAGMYVEYNLPLLHQICTQRKNVVAHEVAHCVVYQMYPDYVRPHGKEWKEIVIKLGGLPALTL